MNGASQELRQRHNGFCHLDRLLQSSSFCSLKHPVIVSLLMISSSRVPFRYSAVIEDYHISVLKRRRYAGPLLSLYMGKVEISRPEYTFLFPYPRRDVVSSRIRMAGLWLRPCKGSLCFCPPERLTPRSPTIVS